MLESSFQQKAQIEVLSKYSNLRYGYLNEDKVKKSEPDLITLDMIMPRMSGLALMKELRSNAAWEEIPVVIITAHAKDEMAKEDVKEILINAEGKQENRFLMEKPIVPSKLIDQVCKILNVSMDEDVASKEDLISAIKNVDGTTLREVRKILDR